MTDRSAAARGLLTRTVWGIPVAIIATVAVAVTVVAAVIAVSRPRPATVVTSPGGPYCVAAGPAAPDRVPAQFVLASAATIQAHTARLTISGDAFGVGYVATGSIDFQAPAVEYSSTGYGQFSQFIYVGGQEYTLIVPGDGWRRGPSLLQAMGPLARQLVVPDPAKLLAVMEKAPTGVRTVGSEVIEGTETTRYCADVPQKAYWGFKVSGDMLVDVWIGERRVLQITVHDQGLDYTEDFSDFGASVHITAPADYHTGL